MKSNSVPPGRGDLVFTCQGFAPSKPNLLVCENIHKLGQWGRARRGWSADAVDERRATRRDRLTETLARFVPKTAPVEGHPDARRQLTTGFSNALATAFELTFTPALFGLLGWWIDGRLGTRPLFLLSFAIFVFGYEVWKLMQRYKADLDRQQAEVLGARRARTEDGR
jgi:F0F1-type ATP synthase assembly protein I